jgi:hypothetical protein
MKDILELYDRPPNRINIKTTLESPDMKYSLRRGKDEFRDMFFSNENIDNIKNVLIYNVYKQTNIILNKKSQSNINLFNEMEDIYDNYSKHPQIITDDMSPAQKRDLLATYKMQIDDLNTIVINKMFPSMVLEVNTQIDYLDYVYTKNKKYYPEASKGRRSD